MPAPDMRALLSLAIAASLSTVAATAAANGSGLAGYTGKQAGKSCNSCHTGGATPTVTINGPATLAPGQTGDYTMVVTTGQTRAAGGIAASDGTKLTAGTGLRASFDELTQDNARTVSGGSATFSFKVTAPASGTTLKLFAVGMAANGNGTGGDSSAQVTKDVAVTGGSTTPAPSTSSSSSSSSSGAAGDDDGDDDDAAETQTTTPAPTKKKSEKKKKKSAALEEEGEESDDDEGASRRASPTYPACSAATGPLDTSAFAIGAFVVAGLLASRRKKR